MRSNKNKLKLLLLVLLLAFSKVAYMSGVRLHKIDFDEMAVRSRVVLVVKKSGTPPLKKSVEISSEGKYYSPFNFYVHTFEVVRAINRKRTVTIGGETVVIPENRTVKAGEVIEVYPANFDSERENQMRFEVNDMMVHVSYGVYEPQDYQENDEIFLLFLAKTNNGKHWTFYCDKSIEGLAFEERVLEPF